jgi:hypothetical protein
MSDRPALRGVPDPELEITPSMIEAGREAYFRALGDIDGIECAPTRDQSAHLVRRVFLAMNGLGRNDSNTE